MPAGGRLLAGLVFLLGELPASCIARRAHRGRDMSEEMNAHIVGVTSTRLPFYHAWVGFMHNSHVSQHRKHLDVRMGIKPHTLLEHLQECPSVVIRTFQGGAATFSSTRGGPTQIYHSASPTEMGPRLDPRRILVRTGIRLQVARSNCKHDHSPVIAVFQKCSRQDKACSPEAMNACCTAGWKRLEVIGGIEKSLERTRRSSTTSWIPRRQPTRSTASSSRP